MGPWGMSMLCQVRRTMLGPPHNEGESEFQSETQQNLLTQGQEDVQMMTVAVIGTAGTYKVFRSVWKYDFVKPKMIIRNWIKSAFFLGFEL